MHPLSAFLLLPLLATFASALFRGTDVEDPQDARLMGAGILDAFSVHFPETVAIFLDDEFNCQGSLISNVSILTSASCLFDFGASSFVEEHVLTVAVGITKISKAPATKLKVAKMDIHPKARLYLSNKNLEYDVALLTLYKPLAMDGNYVDSIKLPSKTSKPDDFVTAAGVVASWGEIETTPPADIYNDALKFINVTIKKDADCKLEHAAYLPSFEITAATICTSVSANKAYCNHDYGAGLRAKDPKTGVPFLLGVASLNLECPPLRSNIYTRVTGILDWLTKLGY